MILCDNEAYFPSFVRVAVDQDRPVGDVRASGEHTHDLYHIVLYAQSAGSYVTSCKRQPAKPGSLVIVSPGQPHDSISHRRSGAYSEITFAFNTQGGKPLTLPFEEILNIYTGVRGRLQRELRLCKNATKELVVIMTRIMDYLQSPCSLSDFYAHRTLADVFDMIVTHCYGERISGATIAQDNPILQVKQYIDEHYAKVITADDLAAMSHCSKGHLFRTFKKWFHVSPLAYQQDLRLKAAQRLLHLTPLRCYEIAQRVGYSSVCYFHRQFKERLGITPIRYRQSLR